MSSKKVYPRNDMAKCSHEGCTTKQNSKIDLCEQHALRSCVLCGVVFKMTMLKQEKCRPCLRPKKVPAW